MPVRLKTGLMAIFVSVILFSSVLLAASAFNEHAARVHARNSEESLLDHRNQIADQSAQLAAMLHETELSIEKLERALPQEDQLPRISADVAKLIEVSSLESAPIRTTRASAVEPLGEQILHLNLTGDFNGFYAFLLQVEQMSSALRVRSMKLTPLPNHDGDLQAEMVLSICFRMNVAKCTTPVGGSGEHVVAMGN